MDTPIYDFAEKYSRSGTVRAHMPGHKGFALLGCEALDITEIMGADELYGAEGIIAQSERNASRLFGSQATFYSTEGSSQCIRAMLALALYNKKNNDRPVILAARNAHKAFILAAAMLDIDIRWLWPEDESFSLCRCSISACNVAKALAAMPEKPLAVYITSPDYLGGMLDIASIADAAHSFGVPLLVDNAHGAYLRFMPKSLHPMDNGADACCDSAHKTLPVLTGGAYLHLSACAPKSFTENAASAMALFGSTSPSYIILESLDICNRELSEGLMEKLRLCALRIDALRKKLRDNGWIVEETDPLKLTVAASMCGWDGPELAEELRKHNIECEYADPDYAVLMLSPYNKETDFLRIEAAFSEMTVRKADQKPRMSFVPPKVACSLRRAVLAEKETVAACDSLGRVLASPTVSCPPAVPVVVSGEVIDEAAIALFKLHGIERVEVIKQSLFPGNVF